MNSGLDSASSRVSAVVIAEAQRGGARLLIDPKDFPADAPGTPYLAPQVLVDVSHSMRIMTEETFGPAVGIMRVRTDEEAVSLMNDSDYGLTAAIFTNDIKTAMATARRVDSGCIWINGTGRHYMGTGFAGWKNSGLGREECLEEVLSYTRSKSIHIIM